MIKKQGTNRRTIEVRVTAKEAEALKAEGFEPQHEPRKWAHPADLKPWVVTLNALERDDLRLARAVALGALATSKDGAENVQVDRTVSPAIERHRAAHTRIASAVNPVAALLHTKEWKGSEIVQEFVGGQERTVLRHPSGARAYVRVAPKGEQFGVSL